MLYGLRYLEGRASPDIDRLKRFVADDLHFLDYGDTIVWYKHVTGFFGDNCAAFPLEEFDITIRWFSPWPAWRPALPQKPYMVTVGPKG